MSPHPPSAKAFPHLTLACPNSRESSQQPADYSGSEEPSAGPVTRRGAGKPIFPTSSPAEPKQIEEAPVSRPSSPVRSVIEFVNKQVAKAPEPEAVVQLVEQRSKQLYSEADRALTGARWVSSFTTLTCMTD